MGPCGQRCTATVIHLDYDLVEYVTEVTSGESKGDRTRTRILPDGTWRTVVELSVSSFTRPFLGRVINSGYCIPKPNILD
jgi:hypothetical protein